jgi:hypothetical protein
MTSSPKKKFLVLYLVPTQVMGEWAKTDLETRKTAEEKMRAEWQQWMRDHAAMIAVTEAAGKTKSVASSGISDTLSYIRSSRPSHMTLRQRRSHNTRTCRFRNHQSKSWKSDLWGGRSHPQSIRPLRVSAEGSARAVT